MFHYIITVMFSRLTEMSAWWDGFVQDRAYWRIDRTEEELQIRRTVDFDQWRELVDLWASVFLLGVVKDVWKYCLVVSDLLAKLYSDRFTAAMVR